jgi:hypothetical protein
MAVQIDSNVAWPYSLSLISNVITAAETQVHDF